MDTTLTTEKLTDWIAGYLRAWRSNDRRQIAALFAENAEYHETPYETEWVGRDEIVDGWRSRWNWQQGGWDFTWEIRSITGSAAVVTGVGTYAELGVFENIWTLAFSADGLCERFEMTNTERESAR
jgi:hypothetical protein